MKFRICGKDEPIIYNRDLVCLQCSKWNDNGFVTTFEATYYDYLGRMNYLGPVKIGFSNKVEGRTADYLSKEFMKLPDNFFSLGQEDTYYGNITNLGNKIRVEILTALNDVAYDLQRFRQFQNQAAMKHSLLRNISTFAVQGQLHRMARGGRRLAEYRFSYAISRSSFFKPTQLEFNVKPESNPPTNVHVVIGRNGTGKTRLIKSMINSICFNNHTDGQFVYVHQDNLSRKAEFANVLCIAFSPFDDFSELISTASTVENKSKIHCSFIGLNKQLIGSNKKYTNLNEAIAAQFFEAFENCMMASQKRRLWLETIEVLKSDRVFADEKIDAFVPESENIDEIISLDSMKRDIMNTFNKLSSGHKVVLLILTGCVDKIEEQSIVFLDEPENHLHPPLLSALIRALSNLLTNRNGVAVVSTHSPVVLQEVPRCCVWALEKHGDHLKAERPSIQTFGATIGSLTNEVFRLEVTDSGFHKLLREAVRQLGENKKTEKSNLGIYVDDYEKITNEFDGQLGDEADILLRTLLALRRKGQQI